MNVIKIVVDELPNGYKNKKSVVEIELYLNYVDGNTTITEYYHGFIDDPLVVEDECVWKQTWEWTDRFMNEGFWHIDTKCNWIYPEDYDATIADLDLDTIGEFVKLMGFTHCPNCGKKIRYEEQP